MGFRNGAYATIWEVKPEKDTLIKARISTSRKNKETGEYSTDFSGWVAFCGTAACKVASRLVEKDKIKLGDVDVTNKYDKEKKVTYVNYTIWSCEKVDATGVSPTTEPQKEVDDGEGGDEFPF